MDQDRPVAPARIAVVTGSSSGIGRCVALALAARGSHVVCADLRPSARTEIKEETEIDTHALIERKGGKAIFIKTDVSVASNVESLVEAAVRWGGRLDILVNNAGIAVESQRGNRIHLFDESDWDLTMRVNARSVFLGSKYAIAQMLQQQPLESGDRGWIVNMSSVFGLVAAPASPSYCASKGAIVSLTRQIAVDYGKDKIHCNAVCPGFVQTAIFHNSSLQPGVTQEYVDGLHPMGGPGRPEDVAGAVLYLTSDAARWITGVCLPIDGGFTAQ
ncbi:gluconate 5-dehydrogenase [Xylariaceae sp. FL1019]|nr:gluconate 5-dehydrogenase [Xylariaceae sp. FL1019]